jgi:3-dehydroquinate synthase
MIHQKTFSINSQLLNYDRYPFPLRIESHPNPYIVELLENKNDYQNLISRADFIIFDKNVRSLYNATIPDSTFVFTVDATEENKCMKTVLELIEQFIRHEVSKGSQVIAIGGGIIQDLVACACALFRRGQPFIYLPTTTLGQLDSCVGAKCAVNTDRAKNIIGLFSAPQKVYIPIFMIQTMSLNDHRAGLSEMLRLCLTASWDALEEYENNYSLVSNPHYLNYTAYAKALELSLSIKKSVVEFDEYERDIRRSMNYGHTFGHAIEKLSNFSLPHGLGVLIGMHMANTFSFKLGLMSQSTYNRILKSIQATFNGVNIQQNKFSLMLNPENIIDQFKYDKKGDGSSVPLILIKEPGNMIFYRHIFSSQSSALIEAVQIGLEDIIKWTTN